MTKKIFIPEEKCITYLQMLQLSYNKDVKDINNYLVKFVWTGIINEFIQDKVIDITYVAEDVQSYNDDNGLCQRHIPNCKGYKVYYEID